MRFNCKTVKLTYVAASSKESSINFYGEPVIQVNKLFDKLGAPLLLVTNSK